MAAIHSHNTDLDVDKNAGELTVDAEMERKSLKVLFSRKTRTFSYAK